MIVKVKVIAPSSINDREKITPECFSLEQNYPNPFNSKTNITFLLPELSEVRVDILNLRGELVTTIFRDSKKAGVYTFIWAASKFHSGTYFIKLQADDFVQLRKCVLLN